MKWGISADSMALLKARTGALKNMIVQKGRRYSATALMLGQYLYMRSGLPLPITEDINKVFPIAFIKPEIIVAGIPVYGVDQIGHASSDEVLKYRSMGGIFLAHQKGGNQTFKFRARVYGPMRYITYKMLEALQLLGTEEALKVVDNLTHPKIPHVKSTGVVEMVNETIGLKIDDSGRQIPDPKTIKDLSIGSPLEEAAKVGEFNEEEYAYHRTFPIITETKIYTNMYLETLVLVRDVKLGYDCIEIQCAFREYEAPTHYQVTDLTAVQSVFDENGNQIGINFEAAKKSYYRIYTPALELWATRAYDIMFNFGWAITNFVLESVKPEEMHKFAAGKYDMEVMTLGTLFGLYTIGSALGG